jgi:hypothetical protein
VFSPDVIIMRRRTVSSGYDIRLAAFVTPQPRANWARNDWRAASGSASWSESYRPK